MKVTALIDDEIVKNVMQLAAGRNLTDSITTALKEWIAQKRIVALTKQIKRRPLRFGSEDIAGDMRSLNRKQT